MSATDRTLANLTETADRLARRLNAIEARERESPPFDRTRQRPPKSPEQAFQDREAAAGAYFFGDEERPLELAA